METKLMTIKDVAEYLRLSEQTIQRYVLKKEIPYLKIKKVIRFHPAVIEEWAEKGGLSDCANKDRNLEGDLFAGVECGLPVADSRNGQTGGPAVGGTKREVEAETGAGGTCCPPVADSLGVEA
jgi:excisionase family DNA binding protein